MVRSEELYYVCPTGTDGLLHSNGHFSVCTLYDEIDDNTAKEQQSTSENSAPPTAVDEQPTEAAIRPVRAAAMRAATRLK